MNRRMGIVLTLGVGLVAPLLACATPTREPQPPPSSTHQLAETGGFDELISALRSDGAVVELLEVGEVAQPFFAVPGQIVELDGTEIQIFEYADAGARREDSDLISSDGFTIGTSMVTWVDQPNFWARGRLIVLYVGRDQDTIDLLSESLGEPIASGAQGPT